MDKIKLFLHTLPPDIDVYRNFVLVWNNLACKECWNREYGNFLEINIVSLFPEVK